MADKKNPMKVITPKFRASFAHVFEAEAYKSNEPKYSITMLFPKDTDLSKLKAAAKAAKDARWGSNPPKRLKTPFKDGDAVDEDGDRRYDYDGYEGMFVVKASSKYAPGVVDLDRHVHLTDSDQFDSGDWARASLLASAYDNESRGVSFILLNVQKLEDGERFGSNSKPENDFDDEVSKESKPSDFDDDWDNDDIPF